ncbi:HET-domain-containing protein, partial [Trematosphaeria pertusa]
MVLSDPLPKYQYRALAHPSHIRILVLFPASNYELSLEAWLIHVDREDILRGRTEPSCYEAISYCWGDAIFSHSLTCDDRTTLPITRNVDIMLRHLRKRHEPRYLWVDAICLNQEDAAEKDTQVRLMGEIYQEATKVCIWLGESKETDGVPQVLRALKTVAIRIRHKDRSGMAAQQREELISVCGSEYRPMFRDFFSRPWFGRRWVLQEAVFGRDVMVRCGHHKLNWSWLVAGVDCLYYPGRSEEGPISDDAFTSAARTVMTIHNGTKMGLLGLLWEHNRSECFLPQDKIFALYNIANDAQQVLNVDYTRHWTKVYTQVARVYIERSGCVILKHLLCFG